MNPPRGDTEARRAAILTAALRVFGRYGYRRASIDDIAREADIGKGTVYLSFTGKEEIFQALSQSLMQRMIADAEAASGRPGTTADRLTAMTLAWFGTYADTIRRSPHAAELLDAKFQLSREHATAAAHRFRRLVADVLAEATRAGELDLASAGLTADTAAELLVASARGQQSGDISRAAHRRSLTALVRVLVAGLAAKS